MVQSIAADLEAVESIYQKTVAHRSRLIRDILEHLNQYRGKRLRPTLLLLTARACGGIRPAHHVLGAVVEMVHTATLVHDDVLDAASLRRHVATVNADWGNKTSILLGDYLFTHAFHLSSSIGETRACELIGEATNRVCEGELLQTLQRGNLELTEADYLQIIEGKTAALTACCCRLGAIYAGASETLVDQMALFGKNLGIAFQIADDLLDLQGTEDKAGKTLGTDLLQMKLTLPVIRMFALMPREESQAVRDGLKRGDAAMPNLVKRMRASGAFEYAAQKAQAYAQAARDQLANLPDSESRSLLAAVTDWSIRRDH